MALDAGHGKNGDDVGTSADCGEIVMRSFTLDIMGHAFGASGGVYVGGGVIEKIDQAGLFDRDRFLRGLVRKGRLSEWLTNVPAFLLRTPYAGLIGAAAALGIQNVSVIER